MDYDAQGHHSTHLGVEIEEPDKIETNTVNNMKEYYIFHIIANYLL